MQYGKIVRFDTDRGFGFVSPDNGDRDVFMHVSALARGGDARQLRPGVRVSYEEEHGDRGTKAAQVQVLSASREDAWPEYTEAHQDSSAGVQPSTRPLSEEEFRTLWDEGCGVALARARQRGWVA
jgi:CspA family cold shock protein